MKAFPSTPLQGKLNEIFESYKTSVPKEVPEEPETPPRPVEIKRFVREQRENRQYSYSRDFMY